MVSDKKIFNDFSYTSLCKTSDPGDGAIFDPQGHNLKNLRRDPLDEATYHIQ